MPDIENLYRTHGSALLAYLRSFGRWASAEDLLHETFVQALRRPDQLDQSVSPRAWLFGIARHVGLTAARRHRPMAALDADHVQPIGPAEPHSDLIDVHAGIAALPSPLRETLELRLREQLSYEEIAHVLEIPIGTVRSRLHTAMRQLRDQLNPDETNAARNPTAKPPENPLEKS
jgi:RNA polymerase sigma-70 factor (ECF subfamily)